MKFFIGLLVLMFIHEASSAELSFLSSFETGAIQAREENPDGWGKIDCGVPESIEVQSNIVRSGKYALKLQLDYEKAKWVRENVSPIPCSAPKGRVQLQTWGSDYKVLKPGVEYWIGLSVFIPLNWQNEQTEEQSTTLWQWANGLRASQLSLRARRDDANGRDVLQIGSLTGGIDPNDQTKDGADRKGRIHWVDDIDKYKGKWMDFVMHFKLSKINGVRRIWLNNDELQLKDNVPMTNIYNVYTGTEYSASPILAIYRSRMFQDWAAPPTSKVQTVYYDELRLAVGKDARHLVDIRMIEGNTSALKPPTDVRVE